MQPGARGCTQGVVPLGSSKISALTTPLQSRWHQDDPHTVFRITLKLLHQKRRFQGMPEIQVTPESCWEKHTWNAGGISPHLHSQKMNWAWSWWIGKAARESREVERLNYKKGTKRIILHNLENQRWQDPWLSLSFLCLLVFILLVLIYLWMAGV